MKSWAFWLQFYKLHTILFTYIHIEFVEAWFTQIDSAKTFLKITRFYTLTVTFHISLRIFGRKSSFIGDAFFHQSELVLKIKVRYSYLRS